MVYDKSASHFGQRGKIRLGFGVVLYSGNTIDEITLVTTLLGTPGMLCKLERDPFTQLTQFTIDRNIATRNLPQQLAN